MATDHDRRTYHPQSGQDASRSSIRSGPLVPIAGLLLLCACASLPAELVAAQEATPPPDSACGQSRLVLVRFTDGQPAPGVTLTLSAASAAMGGPELYSSQGSSVLQTDVRGGQDAPVSPLATPGSECTPVITATLTVTTDGSGLARFDRLGEGNWILSFEGEVRRASKVATIVPPSVQGLFPYGRTREGGGFVERFDALNEHGGPNPEPVQPGTGPTTSRYVLGFSAEHGGWLPVIDLADEDDAPPVPLSAVSLVITVTPEAGPLGGTPISGNTDYQQRDSDGESSFDPSAVEEAYRWDEGPARPGQQPHRTDLFTVWWAVALVLAVGALAVVWRVRRNVA